MSKNNLIKLKQNYDALLYSITNAYKKKKITKSKIGPQHINFYINKIIKLKNKYPVNLITYDDFIFWPALRHYIWMKLYRRMNGHVQNFRTIDPMEFGNISDNWMQEYQKFYNAEPVNDLEEKQVDFLYLCDARGHDRWIHNDTMYNRIMDPLHNISKNISSSEKIAFIKVPGRHLNSYFQHPTFVLPATSSRPPIDYTKLHIPDGFISAVNKHIPELQFKKHHIYECLESFFDAYHFFDILLEKRKPKYVFCIAIAWFFPLFLAAKRRGIHAVELQHGTQNNFGITHYNWQETPTSGYKLFPEYQFTWGKDASIDIQRNLKGIKAIETGYPWAEFSKKCGSDPDAIILKKIKDAEKVILIAMQDQSSLPDIFYDLINEADQNILWIIRKHPKHTLQIDSKKISQIENIHLQTDMSVPVSKIIQHADIHITMDSAVIYEATALKIPTFVYDRGIETFASYLGDGLIYPLTTKEAFFHTIHQPDFKELAQKSHNRLCEIIDLEQTFQHLLDNYESTPKI